MTDIKLNENWEAEQEAEIIAECKSDIARYEEMRNAKEARARKCESNAVRCKLRAEVRYYNRKIAVARRTLALAGVEA